MRVYHGEAHGVPSPMTGSELLNIALSIGLEVSLFLAMRWRAAAIRSDRDYKRLDAAYKRLEITASGWEETSNGFKELFGKCRKAYKEQSGQECS